METSEESNKLPEGCAMCGKTDDLLRCSGCKIIHYCSRDHQSEHRPQHKFSCSEVRRARETMEKAKQDLINHPDLKNDNPFENHVGRFWTLVETRPYMMSLSKLVYAIQGIEHVDAVQAELDLCMEMLRLCPGDNMGVRGSVPNVMLRLNKDQECYDFIKWWETTANDENYALDDYHRFLDIKNADIFESVDFVSDLPHGDLSHKLCLMLLKIKLLVELLKLENTEGAIDEMISEKFSGAQQAPPPEVFKEFLKEYRSSCVNSPAILARKDFMNGEGLSATIQAVKQQIDRLYAVIDTLNKHVWPAIAKIEETLRIPRSNMFKLGSEEEMRIALNQVWSAWMETPGAFEFIAFKIAGKLDLIL